MIEPPEGPASLAAHPRSDGVSVQPPAPVTAPASGSVTVPAAPAAVRADADGVAPDRDFDAFCREHYARVTGLAYVLSGSRTAAEDLTQDAFFAAFRQWGRLCQYDDPGAWVRRVVANRAVSRRRRLQSESRALLRIGSRRSQVE